jgi:hypothetical protein
MKTKQNGENMFSLCSLHPILQSIQFFVSDMISTNLTGSRDSVVHIKTGYWLDDRGVGVRVSVGSRIFSSPRRPDWLWGPTSLLLNAYRGALSPGLKRRRREANTQLQLVPKSRDCAFIHPLPHMSSWRSA